MHIQSAGQYCVLPPQLLYLLCMRHRLSGKQAHPKNRKFQIRSIGLQPVVGFLSFYYSHTYTAANFLELRKIVHQVRVRVISVTYQQARGHTVFA